MIGAHKAGGRRGSAWPVGPPNQSQYSDAILARSRENFYCLSNNTSDENSKGWGEFLPLNILHTLSVTTLSEAFSSDSNRMLHVGGG